MAQAILSYGETLDFPYPHSPNMYSYPVPLSPYDSDIEVLIPRSSTASSRSTGHSIPYVHGQMYIPPNIIRPPPQDDDIIPAIVVDVIPREGSTKEKKGILNRFIGGKKKDDKGLLKVVYMPRREYNKYFARGFRGEYTGSEPYRKWREEELEDQFSRYKPADTMWRKKGRMV